MKGQNRHLSGRPDWAGCVPVMAVAVLLAAACAAGGWSGTPGWRPLTLPIPGTEGISLPAGRFITLFAIQWALCIALLLLLPREFSLRQKVGFLFALGLLCRLLLLAQAPSDDMNRYLWEGRPSPF